MNFQLIVGIFFLTTLLKTNSFAKSINCQKEAEAIGISESKKKGNLPDHLLSVANPTEQDGANVIVYIGARANYNYFKMKLNKKCKLVKLIDAEYAD